MAKFAKATVDLEECEELFLLLVVGNGKEASEKCLDAVTRARDAIKQLGKTFRVADRTVRLTRLPAGCKRALATSEESYARGPR